MYEELRGESRDPALSRERQLMRLCDLSDEHRKLLELLVSADAGGRDLSLWTAKREAKC